MKKVFVIEDDRGWESYYKRILKGYDLSCFHDGVEAIAAMDEQVPDLVLLDVLLTGPTGFAVIHEMRSFTELEKVPVLLVSSVEMGDFSKEYGIAGYLDKATMTPRSLLDMVKYSLTEATND